MGPKPQTPIPNPQNIKILFVLLKNFILINT
jgi:hypothetical protein